MIPNLAYIALNHVLQYAKVTLNRADVLRGSADEINSLWCHPNCRIVILHNNKSLFNPPGFNPVIVSQSELRETSDDTQRTFLGLDSGGSPYFSLQIGDNDAEQWCSIYPNAEFHDLRAAGAALDAELASVLAYARGLSHWQSVTGYCSKCGGENQLESSGHSMRCQQCQSLVFPRTDPAVIMLVEHEDQQGSKRCLLGRSPAWPEGCYSTLAGFVETGESLEAAVIREVFEEAGIRVTNPRYVASQPWPFPQSIMLGFTATAVNDEIVLDKEELANADWFSADELKDFGEWADSGDGFKLPRVDSIARLLIDSWVAEQKQST